MTLFQENKPLLALNFSQIEKITYEENEKGFGIRINNNLFLPFFKKNCYEEILQIMSDN